jgi:hypothetical protein
MLHRALAHAVPAALLELLQLLELLGLLLLELFLFVFVPAGFISIGLLPVGFSLCR